MNTHHSFSRFKFDVWLINELQAAPDPGLTLEELKSRWAKRLGRKNALSRDMLTNHRKHIEEIFGIIIATPDRKHYRIMNPKALKVDTFSHHLLKSIQDYIFLQEYKDLGDLIQPEQIDTGSKYLQSIGLALRNKQKLRITYQKFTDEASYQATVHPYCLKANKGRWYILAHKEGEKEAAQCFALDRTLDLAVMPDTFVPNPEIDVSTYFHDCFGVWREFEKYPVRDVTISCTPKVAHYLRTLPLHHSQKEEPYAEGEEGWVVFKYHISPSPDFIGELRTWGDELKIKDKDLINALYNNNKTNKP